jgi:hypothetical protein
LNTHLGGGTITAIPACVIENVVYQRLSSFIERKDNPMRFRLLVPIAILAALSLQATLRAADEQNDSDEAAKIAALGPGVNAETVIKDKEGRIVSLLVVGQSRISTVLGKSKGLEVAREKADLDAEARFVQFLNKGTVKMTRSTDDETIELYEGTEGGGEDSLKVASKASERLVVKKESAVQGFVRSLQKVAESINSEDKTLTVIKAWEADTDKSAKKLASDLASDEIDEPSRNKGNSSKSKSASADDKEIKDRTVTSGALKRFLPKSK